MIKEEDGLNEYDITEINKTSCILIFVAVFMLIIQMTNMSFQKIIEKSRECHNHKTQPNPRHQEEEKNDKK